METGEPEIQQNPEIQPAPRPADVVQAEFSLTAEAWSGPLPHPDTLERYEKLIPGSADRLLAAFERQVAHRHNMDHREARRLDWGLASAFLVVTMIITAGAVLIFLGRGGSDWREHRRSSCRVYFRGVAPERAAAAPRFRPARPKVRVVALTL